MVWEGSEDLESWIRRRKGNKMVYKGRLRLVWSVGMGVYVYSALKYFRRGVAQDTTFYRVFLMGRGAFELAGTKSLYGGGVVVLVRSVL